MDLQLERLPYNGQGADFFCVCVCCVCALALDSLPREGERQERGGRAAEPWAFNCLILFWAKR